MKNKLFLLWSEHRSNVLLSVGIIIVGILIIALLKEQNNMFKTSLFEEDIIFNITLQAEKVESTTVELLWKDQKNDSAGNNLNQNSYTSEVSVNTSYTNEVSAQKSQEEIRVYKGNVETYKLPSLWNSFTPISFSPQGIVENGKEKKVTAIGLEPNTLYTFALLKISPSGAMSMSNALSVTTKNSAVVPSKDDNQKSSKTIEKGDVNDNKTVNEEDAYAVTMYLYFKNWSAFITSMQAQGIAFDPTVTESVFKQQADVDGNCTVDFQDSALITKFAKKKITKFSLENSECK